jgi:hypothetical protein
VKTGIEDAPAQRNETTMAIRLGDHLDRDGVSVWVLATFARDNVSNRVDSAGRADRFLLVGGKRQVA